jgi:hypothetical protein
MYAWPGEPMAAPLVFFKKAEGIRYLAVRRKALISIRPGSFGAAATRMDARMLQEMLARRPGPGAVRAGVLMAWGNLRDGHDGGGGISVLPAR